jgi:hypothetical protein
VTSPKEPEVSASITVATWVVCVSMVALMMFQILQTVTLSLQIFHNTAFLVISFCMFGLGGGGSLAALLRHRGWTLSPALLWRLSLAFSISLVVAGALNSRMNSLEALIFTGFIPYLFVGLLLPMIFQAWPAEAGRIYFFDLVGSGLGAVSLIVVLNGLGDAGRVQLVIAGIALIGTLVAALSHTRNAVIATLAVAVGVAALWPLSDRLFIYQPGPDKAYGKILRDPEMHSTLEWSKWNYLGRLDSVVPGRGVENFGYYGDWVRDESNGGSTTRLLFASGDNWSSTIDFKDDAAYRERFLRESVPAAPYILLEGGPDVLSVGLGGGIDVFLALEFGAQSVVGIEINPLMIEAARDRYPSFFDDPYRDSRVTIHEIDGRTFANATEKRFDLITLTAVDTGAGLSAGAYVLSENYLYTQEAFDTYFDLLEPGGLLFVYKPRMPLTRVIATATATLRKRGVEDPHHHIALFGGGFWVGCIIGRDPLPSEGLARLAKHVDAGGFGGSRYYIRGSGIGRDKGLFNLMMALAGDRELQFLAEKKSNYSPITDDRPFFYDFGRDFPSSDAGRTLLRILALVTTGAAVLILLPLVAIRREAEPTAWFASLGYFSSIGLGFMLVEVALIQKLVLFLGHPSYSLTVTLFSMLLFSGLGSLIVDRFEHVPTHFIASIVPGILLALALYALGLAPLLDSAPITSLIGRSALAACVLAPGSLLMGMMLPAMIRAMDERSVPLISWAWGVNAFASVVASVLAVILSMQWGFGATLMVGALCYIAAAAFSLLYGRGAIAS